MGARIGHDCESYDTYPEESVVLLPLINVASGALTHMDLIRAGRVEQGGRKVWDVPPL